ncbi:hypothetical protein [Anaerotruncus rubiinfantis]|uniref:hypothetical protein n=1 Tax=Anaerotruncus rubiinfantis TaxID=1720200 RepID=UPI0008324363|nr:hypothetical protein [Anaerotruncus rubiinfantis]
MYQPAHKRLAKLTAIELDREKADELRDYFWSHKPPEILPPLFDEYVIRITYSAEWIQKNFGGQLPLGSTSQEIYVCHDTPTKTYLLSYMEGKKQVQVTFDYNDTVEDDKGRLSLRYNVETLMPITAWASDDELHQEANDIINLYRYVTFYLLYYRPDVEYADRPVSRSSRPRTNRGTGKQANTFVLRSKVRRYSIDRHEIPTERNYRKFAWSVRGHYRRGKNGKLIYVTPHQARRRSSGERAAPRKYVIKT